MVRFLILPLVGLLLACGGMMSVFIPDLPVEMPARTKTFSGRVEEADGVTTTRVSGIHPHLGTADLRDDLSGQLAADGWSVSTQPGDADQVTLTAVRDGESVVITLEGRAPIEGVEPSSSFEIVWVQGAATP